MTDLKMTKLSELDRFGLAVFEEMRRDLGDIDGGWLQDKAEGLGLLSSVEVTEPCGDGCKCVEYGEFPQDCLRETDYLRPLLAAYRQEEA